MSLSSRAHFSSALFAELSQECRVVFHTYSPSEINAIQRVEMVLNSRPLTVVSAEDLEEPLTPSHLIVVYRLMEAPDPQCPDHDEFEVDSDIATKRARMPYKGSILVVRFIYGTCGTV